MDERTEASLRSHHMTGTPESMLVRSYSVSQGQSNIQNSWCPDKACCHPGKPVSLAGRHQRMTLWGTDFTAHKGRWGEFEGAQNPTCTTQVRMDWVGEQRQICPQVFTRYNSLWFTSWSWLSVLCHGGGHMPWSFSTFRGLSKSLLKWQCRGETCLSGHGIFSLRGGLWQSRH